MKQKKIPMRMCVVTRERIEKRNLIRIVKTDDGIVVDPTGKVNGHGVYVKKDLEIIQKAKDKNILESIFNCNVSDEVFERAKELVEDGK